MPRKSKFTKSEELTSSLFVNSNGANDDGDDDDDGGGGGKRNVQSGGKRGGTVKSWPQQNSTGVALVAPKHISLSQASDESHNIEKKKKETNKIKMNPDQKNLELTLEQISKCAKKQEIALTPNYLMNEAVNVLGVDLVTNQIKSSKIFQNISNLIKELANYVDAFRYCRTISTLYDLNKEICQIYKIKSFNELGIGPIYKQQYIRQAFSLNKASNDLCHIPEISATDVVSFLNQYRRKIGWGIKIDKNDFKQSFAEFKHLAKNPYDLCVELNSGFPGVILSKFGDVNKLESKYMNELKLKLTLDMQTQIDAWSITHEEAIQPTSVINFWLRFRAQATHKSYPQMVKFVLANYNIMETERNNSGIISKEVLRPSEVGQKKGKKSKKVSLVGSGGLRRNIGEVLTALLYLVEGPVTLLLDKLVTDKQSIDKEELLSSMQDSLNDFETATMPRLPQSEELLHKDKAASHDDVGGDGKAMFSDPLNDEHEKGGVYQLFSFLIQAESLVLKEFGNVKFTDLGHGSFLQVLMSLDESSKFIQFLKNKFSGLINNENNNMNVDVFSQEFDDIEQENDVYYFGGDDDLQNEEVKDKLLNTKTVLKTIKDYLFREVTCGRLDREGEDSVLGQLESLSRYMLDQFGVSQFSELKLDQDSLSSFLHYHYEFLNDQSNDVVQNEKEDNKESISNDFYKEFQSLVNKTIQRTSCRSLSQISLEDLFHFLDIAFPDLTNIAIDVDGSKEDETNQRIMTCEQSICDWLDIAEVSDLGYGDMNHLIAQRKVKSKISTPWLTPAHALTPSSSSSAPSSFSVNNPSDAQFALQCVNNAPFLVDLSSWLQWPLVFEHYHGTLSKFLRTTEDHSQNFKVFECGVHMKGALLKYDGNATLESLNSACTIFDSFEVSVQLFSLLILRKGVIGDEIDYWNLGAISPMLLRLFTIQNDDDGGTCPKQSLSRVCCFVLSIFRYFPTNSPDVESLVMSLVPLLLDPMFKACHPFTMVDVQKQLLSNCQDFNDRSLLHRIALSGYETRANGSKLLIFMQDFESTVCSERPINDNSSLLKPMWNHNPSSPSSSTRLSSSLDTSEPRSSSRVESSFVVDNNYHKEEEDDENGDGDDNVETHNIDPTLKEKSQTVQSEDENAKRLACAKVITDLREKRFKLHPHSEQDIKQTRSKTKKVNVGNGSAEVESDEEEEDSQESIMNRSLEALSAGLYSEDIHFVLELIQNADDNAYEATVIPELEFELDEAKLLVINNENGFRKKDVRALCNVGASTKGTGGGGYIGQKGIGFKSVFSISNEPAIHSNGFHFHLDIKRKIIPHLIEEKDIPSFVFQKQNKAKTIISLPLNEKMSNRTQYLSNKFDDITPNLLLFLNKLRKLTVIDHMNDHTTRKMERIDHAKGLVELRTNDESQQFIVLKSTIEVPATVARNLNCLKTDIAIAFAVDEVDNGNDDDDDAGTRHHITRQANLSEFPVFSYLPVQPYGFRFILQGDFILSSGREAISQDAPWNRFLKDKLSDLFFKAVEEAKQQSSPLNIQLVLDAIPREHEVVSFFKSSAQQVIHCLKAVACLPVEVDLEASQDEEEACWSMPSRTVMASDLDREYMQAPLLKQYLGKCYTHSSIHISEQVACELGVGTLDCEDLIHILVGVCQQGSLKPETGLWFNWLCRWFYLFHLKLREWNKRSLNGGAGQIPEKMRKKLTCLAIFPLLTSSIAQHGVDEELQKNTILTSLDDGVLFFNSDDFRDFQGELRMLDSSFLEASDSAPMKAVIPRLLKQLGVQHLTEEKILQEHIFPHFIEVSNMGTPSSSSSCSQKDLGINNPQNDVVDEEDFEEGNKMMKSDDYDVLADESYHGKWVTYIRLIARYISKTSNKNIDNSELFKRMNLISTFCKKYGIPLPVMVLKGKHHDRNDFNLQPNTTWINSKQTEICFHPYFSNYEGYLYVLFSKIPNIIQKAGFQILNLQLISGFDIDELMKNRKKHFNKQFHKDYENSNTENHNEGIIMAKARSEQGDLSIELKEWLALISRGFGCVDFLPNFKHLRNKVSNKILQSSSQWKNIWNKYHSDLTNGIAYIEDWSCPKLEYILKNMDGKGDGDVYWFSAANALAHILSTHFRSSFPSSFCLEEVSVHLVYIGDKKLNFSSKLIPSQISQPSSSSSSSSTSNRSQVLSASESSLLSCMKKVDWIPCSYYNNECLDRVVKTKLMNSGSVFRKSYTNLCQHHVAYLQNSLERSDSHQTSFWRMLDIPSQVTRIRLLQCLSHWATQDTDGTKGFTTSIFQMEQIYRELSNSGKEDAQIIRQRFQNEKLVWIPGYRRDEDHGGKQAKVNGQFLGLSSLVMNDPSFMMEELAQRTSFNQSASSLPRCIGAHYNSFSSFFSRQLCKPCRESQTIIKFGNRGCSQCLDEGVNSGLDCAIVPSHPSFETYIHALLLISSSSADSKTAYDSCLPIFKMFGDTVTNTTERNSSKYHVYPFELELWSKFLLDHHLPIFPTVDDEWKAIQDKIIYIDDENFESNRQYELFSNNTNVDQSSSLYFIKLPTGNHEIRKPIIKLLSFLKIPSLSYQSISEEVEVELKIASPVNMQLKTHNLELAFAKAVQIVQRYLYHKQSEWYKSLVESNIETLLSSLMFKPFTCLKIKYILTMTENEKMEKDDIISGYYYHFETNSIYYKIDSSIKREHVIDFGDFADELIQMFQKVNVHSNAPNKDISLLLMQVSSKLRLVYEEEEEDDVDDGDDELFSSLESMVVNDVLSAQKCPELPKHETKWKITFTTQQSFDEGIKNENDRDNKILELITDDEDDEFHSFDFKMPVRDTGNKKKQLVTQLKEEAPSPNMFNLPSPAPHPSPVLMEKLLELEELEEPSLLRSSSGPSSSSSSLTSLNRAVSSEGKHFIDRLDSSETETISSYKPSHAGDHSMNPRVGRSEGGGGKDEMDHTLPSPAQWCPQSSNVNDYIIANQSLKTPQISLLDNSDYFQQQCGGLMENIASNSGKEYDEFGGDAVSLFGEFQVYAVLKQGKIRVTLSSDDEIPSASDLRVDDLRGWSCEWVNKNGESLLPYDIKLTKNMNKDAIEEEGNQGEDECIFIEVKTTTHQDKKSFEISINELECAKQHSEKYWIARVFLTNKNNDVETKIVIVKNPYDLISTKGANLLMRF